MKEKKYYIFSNNLKYQMGLHNKSRNDLCEDLGFNYTTVREWCNGTAFPRYDKLEKLVSYFGISKSDLLEDKEHLYDVTNCLENAVLLNDTIKRCSNNKYQEELLIKCTMLNLDNTKKMIEQADYYLYKQDQEENEFKYLDTYNDKNYDK